MSSSYEDELRLYFDLGLKVYIHEQKHFYHTSNKLSKFLFFQVYPDQTTPANYISLDVVEYQELNLPNDPCNDDPAYSFKACVNQFISSEVICHNND